MGVLGKGGKIGVQKNQNHQNRIEGIGVEAGVEVEVQETEKVKQK